VRIQSAIRGYLAKKIYEKKRRPRTSLRRLVAETKNVKITSTEEKVEDGEVYIVYTDGTEYRGKKDISKNRKDKEWVTGR